MIRDCCTLLLIPVLLLFENITLAEEPLPWIDLSDKLELQVLSEDSRGKHSTQPHTVLFADGKTMLLTYKYGDRGPKFAIKRSEDGGLTWSDRLPVPESFGDRKGKFGPVLHRLTDRKGKKRLVLFTSFPWMRRAISEDDGQTWTELEDVFPADYKKKQRRGSGLRSILRLKDGRHIAMYQVHRVHGQDSTALFLIGSEDGGVTWSLPREVRFHKQLRTLVQVCQC